MAISTQWVCWERSRDGLLWALGGLSCPSGFCMYADARLITSLKAECMSCTCFCIHDKNRSKHTEKSNKSNADLDPFHLGSSLMCSHTSLLGPLLVRAPSQVHPNLEPPRQGDLDQVDSPGR